MRLVPPSIPCLRQLVAGNLPAAGRESGLSFGRVWPDDHEMREGLAVHLSGCEHNPRDRLWRVYIVADEEATALGHAGFKGGPSRHGEVEMYWCIEPPFRSRGIARAAARSLMQYAFRQAPVRAIIATIARQNVPSQKVALSIGMREVLNEMRHGLPLWRLTRDTWTPAVAPMEVAPPALDANDRFA